MSELARARPRPFFNSFVESTPLPSFGIFEKREEKGDGVSERVEGAAREGMGMRRKTLRPLSLSLFLPMDSSPKREYRHFY